MLTLHTVTATDWDAVRRIYAEGIATGLATFETDVPSWDTWDASHLADGRLIAKNGTEIVGWAALTPVSSRCVYAGVAEVSVYVADSARGQGVGTFLLNALVAASETLQIWTLQAGIMSDNQASIKLHEKCGFRIVGKRERIGQLHGIWRDTVLMERRSEVIGND